MINGQNMGDVAKIRYGLFPMSFNGCEVISVCNALEYCGKPQEVKTVAKYMFRYSMLFGFFGCNPYFIGSALKHFGIESKSLYTVRMDGKAFSVNNSYSFLRP